MNNSFNKNIGTMHLLMLILICASCNGIWNLDDKDNELIPNYSETLFNIDVIQSMQSNIIALDDNNFITATQDRNSEIQLRKKIKNSQMIIG